MKEGLLNPTVLRRKRMDLQSGFEDLENIFSSKLAERHFFTFQKLRFFRGSSLCETLTSIFFMVFFAAETAAGSVYLRRSFQERSTELNLALNEAVLSSTTKEINALPLMEEGLILKESGK